MLPSYVLQYISGAFFFFICIFKEKRQPQVTFDTLWSTGFCDQLELNVKQAGPPCETDFFFSIKKVSKKKSIQEGSDRKPLDYRIPACLHYLVLLF